MRCSDGLEDRIPGSMLLCSNETNLKMIARTFKEMQQYSIKNLEENTYKALLPSNPLCTQHYE